MRFALGGYLSFAETVLDQARVARAPSRPRLMRMLADTLVATIAAARTSVHAAWVRLAGRT